MTNRTPGGQKGASSLSRLVAWQHSWRRKTLSVVWNLDRFDADLDQAFLFDSDSDREFGKKSFERGLTKLHN